MENFDAVYIADSSSMAKNKENMIEYANNRIKEFGHVVKVVDKPYPEGGIDEYGNTVYKRTYYFENGRIAAREPWRAKTKYKLANI